MTSWTDQPRLHPAARRRRRVLVALAFVLSFIGVSLLDHWYYAVFAAHTDAAKAALDASRLRQLFYAAGDLRPWLALAVAFLLIDHRSAPRGAPWAAWWRRALLLAGGVVISGGIAELLKMACGRLRPIATDGAYVFKPFLSGFTDQTNLGLPSSHTAVAFAAAFVLGRLHPGCRPVVLLIGAGCAWVRVSSGAHFLSDALLGGWIGYAVAAGLFVVDRPVQRRVGAAGPGGAPPETTA